MPTGNQLHYGDNLEVLRRYVPDASVDLIYLDPPFNSNRAYNVLFSRQGFDDTAQVQAFDDAWRWTPVTEQQFDEYANGGLPFAVADALGAFRTLVGTTDMLAYLVNMAPRLVELHRVLKRTGSLYLHCDPTASHYLKILLDAVFGAEQFRNEVIWKRSHGHNSAQRYGPSHDVLLLYGKSRTACWNQVFQKYDPAYVEKHFRHLDADGRRYKHENPTGAGVRRGATGEPWRGIDPTSKGRHWARPPAEMDKLDQAGLIHWPAKVGAWPYVKLYLDERLGMPLQDVWTDIDPINMVATERLGYPTQKPVSLLARIIAASSNPGDVVLDPFCGCGTTIDAAVRLQRRWIGIDVTYIAVDLIRKRLLDSFGPSVSSTYTVTGIPSDLRGAQALMDQSPFEFERWAVSLVDGTPNEKQVGDGGFDGIIRFHHAEGKGPADGRILVSVKGGRQLNPSMVQALDGALTTHRAHMGIFVTLNPPTRGMVDTAHHGGNYIWPANGQRYPRLQIMTVAELLAGKRPQTPPRLLPYISAVRQPSPGTEQTMLQVGEA